MYKSLCTCEPCIGPSPVHYMDARVLADMRLLSVYQFATVWTRDGDASQKWRQKEREKKRLWMCFAPHPHCISSRRIPVTHHGAFLSLKLGETLNQRSNSRPGSLAPGQFVWEGARSPNMWVQDYQIIRNRFGNKIGQLPVCESALRRRNVVEWRSVYRRYMAL